ncbi:MAG: hypothetical protein AAF926_01405 [Pseudomonadota bacterium]
MTDATAMLIVVLLAVVVVALFIYNGRQKRRFEADRAERRRKLEEIKAKARAEHSDERPKDPA